MTAAAFRKITLVITEDVTFQHESFVQGLALYADLEMIGEAWNPDEAVDVVTNLKPDVVLFDLKYTGWDRESVYEAIQRMRTGSPDSRLLAFTAYADLGPAARTAGCDRVMYKEAGVSIKDVHAAIVALGSQPREARCDWKKDIGATPAELDAFMAYLHTGSRDEAAHSRNVEPTTQKNQEKFLREKLAAFSGEEVSTMAQAITVAMRLGLIERKDFQRPAGPD